MNQSERPSVIDIYIYNPAKDKQRGNNKNNGKRKEKKEREREEKGTQRTLVACTKIFTSSSIRSGLWRSACLSNSSDPVLTAWT